MVFMRTMDARHLSRPNYEPTTKYLSVTFYFGGQFQNMPNAKYVGGDWVVFDWVKANEINCLELDKFSEQVGVECSRRYHLKLRGGAFVFCGTDRQLRKWAHQKLHDRECEIYVETVIEDPHTVNPDIDSEYESYEDPDYAIGNEIDDDDDLIFESNVDNVDEDTTIIDPSNITVSSVFVECPIELAHGVEGGEGSNGGVEGVNTANNGDARDKGKQHVQEESSEGESDSENEGDVVEVHDDFNEHRMSEDDDEEPNYPVFNPKTTYNPEFHPNQIFANKKEFKLAAQSHAIKHRRSIKFIKNDERRVYVRCRVNTCKWMMNVLKRKGEESFQIKKICVKHSCIPDSDVKNLTSTWLSERFLQKFQSDKNRDVMGFMSDASCDTRCNVSRQQAYRAKVKAVKKIEGDPDVQFSKLWSYVDEIRKTNPGSTILLGTDVSDGVTRFSKLYVCFYALKVGFMRGCRPILGVDGTFLKGKYGGILLTAVGVDANNNLFPVAYAMVEKENGEIWEWFLTVLKQDLGINSENFTFLSDKQKGLIQAFQSVFPESEHRFCVRHLHNNMKNEGYRGLAYKQALWKAACSTTMGEFKLRMDELKALNEGCWQWLNQRPPEQWSKAFFSEHSKCDMVLNNVCEAFNGIILEARSKAIITMAEWIREHLTKRLAKNRDSAMKKWRGRLCPRIEKIIERNSEKVADCVAIRCSDRHYQVSIFEGGQYTVDIETRTCSCRAWQLSGIPCTHAICALRGQSKDPTNFVDVAYTVETYLKAYENPILGISYEALWGESLFIPPLPPDFGIKKTKGRQATKRRLEPDEKAHKGRKKTKGRVIKIRRQQTTVKCRKCGTAGHNAATCGKRAAEQAGGNETIEQVNFQVQTDGGNHSVGSHSSCQKRKVQTKIRPSEETQTSSSEINMAPPNYEKHSESDGVDVIPEVATQESQVINSRWNPYANAIPRHGPSMYHQLQLGQLALHPGVQIRAPPPSFSDQYVNYNRGQLRSESSKTIFVDGAGQKFMDLSSKKNDLQRGKNKQ